MHIDESRYQRFNPGHLNTASDSFAKLSQVGFPSDFVGKSYLDIGCNTGFFCFEAERRGAPISVGIDSNRDFLKLGASIRDELGLNRTQLLHLPWDDLDKVQGTFDIVSLMSALHYCGRDMHGLMARIYEKLNPGGLFILEAGISPHRLDDILVEAFVRKADANSGARTYYPNEKCVHDMLSPYAEVRKIGRSQDLDERERWVFHALKAPLRPVGPVDVVENTFVKHPELKKMFSRIMGIAEVEISGLLFHVPWGDSFVGFAEHPIHQFISEPSASNMGNLAQYFVDTHPRKITMENLVDPIRDTIYRFRDISRLYNPEVHLSLPVVHVEGKRVLDGTNRLLILLFSGVKRTKVILVSG